MLKNKFLMPLAFVALFGFAACDAAEDDADFESQEVITEPTMEEQEVMVPAEDTMLVEREVDMDVDVDTTEVEGDRARARDTIN